MTSDGEIATKITDVQVEPLRDSKTAILANEWHGKETVKVNHRPKPLITNPRDVILKVTSTAICGSDLHLYHNCLPGVNKGDVLGHEFMGVVEEIGPEVQTVQPGDRVVACFDLGCGECFYCQKQLYSACDVTNPPSRYSKMQESLYGHHTGGIYGYSHLTGGYDGGQAEYARVPFGDVNLLKVGNELPDERVLFLSDILPTAWHANELAEVGPGDTVAIWGAGPVGQLAVHCAFHRGAKHVILIDNVQYRLDFAKEKLGGSNKLDTINFNEHDVEKRCKELAGINGVDKGIEAVGVHYTKSMIHAVQMGTMVETDPPEIINEMIRTVRKGGKLGIVGVYVGYTNGFLIGGFMEKGMSMSAGQTPVQKYWHMLLEKIKKEELHPNFVITHELPLEKGPHGYHMFDKKMDNCIKVVLKPGLASSAA